PMIVGTAMLTMVVSSKIAKKPTQITASASHGLVSRATRSAGTLGAAAPAMGLTTLAMGVTSLYMGHVPEGAPRLRGRLRGPRGNAGTAGRGDYYLAPIHTPPFLDL